MKEHYDEETTRNISLGGKIPLMNSLPFETALLNPRYFNGKNAIDFTQGMAMNIGFREGTEPPNVKKGDTVLWHFYDEQQEVRIIDRAKLFVQGINVVLYVVQFRVKQ